MKAYIIMDTKTTITEVTVTATVTETTPITTTATTTEDRTKISAKAYNELRALKAVQNTKKSFKPSTKVKTTSRQETVTCICPVTGIISQIIMPAIPGKAFEVINPLSLYTNVKGLLTENEEYLKKLDTQILAGIWITAFMHYPHLLHNRNTTGAGMNTMLRTAGKSILIDSLKTFLFINSSNYHKLPPFSLEYAAHSEFASIGPALQEHTKTVRSILFPPAVIEKAKELKEIEEKKYKNDTSFVVNKVKGAKTTTAQQLWDTKFQANRKEAKLLLANMTEHMSIPSVLIAKLRPIFVGMNLATMSDVTRVAVVTRLQTFVTKDAQRLAIIVQEGKDPYAESRNKDILDEGVIMGELSKPAQVQSKPMSLKEKLAARLAGTLPVVAGTAVLQLNEQQVNQQQQTDEEVAVATIDINDDENILKHLSIETDLEEGNLVSEEDLEWNDAFLRIVDKIEVKANKRNIDNSGEDF